jgi:SAM-dependent methyltransferase
MTNTPRSFHDKWERNKDLGWSATQDEHSEIHRWILNRNGFPDLLAFKRHLGGKRRILDAGCGNGRVTMLLRNASDPIHTEVVGVDLVAAEVARGNLEGSPNLTIKQADLLQDLTALGQFDFIYCQEVLHHTGDPRSAFRNLAGILDKGGELAIYVYKKKAPCREFSDDYIRARISDLPYDEAMEACRQITDLGRVLANLNVNVTVPAVDVLEIKAGEYDLQRFVYHFFMKCFWNAEFSHGDNAAINYDWFHPQDATRHTVDEVRTWFQESSLSIVHEHVDEYGITMRGRRQT